MNVKAEVSIWQLESALKGTLEHMRRNKIRDDNYFLETVAGYLRLTTSGGEKPLDIGVNDQVDQTKLWRARVWLAHKLVGRELYNY